MKINKDYVKSKDLWLGLVILLLGFFPDIKEVVITNFDTLNNLLGALLAVFGVKQISQNIKD